MKYKVGDKVLIKSIRWYIESNKDICGNVLCGTLKFTSTMIPNCGEILTIKHVSILNTYFMEESIWEFNDEMIERLATKCEICGNHNIARCFDVNCNKINKDMETKEIRIQVPEGMEIDRENSTFECIKFKPKVMTYTDVIDVLSHRFNAQYYITSFGMITKSIEGCTEYTASNAAYSTKQLEKLLAINKLMTVALYLNDGWKPNWKNIDERKYFIKVYENTSILTDYTTYTNSQLVHFKSGVLAKKAVEILGEDTIRLALTTDY